MRYRRYVGESICWVRSSLEILPDPDTGNVIAFFHTADINDEVIDEMLAKRIMGMNYETVAYCDLQSGRLFINSAKNSSDRMLDGMTCGILKGSNVVTLYKTWCGENDITPHVVEYDSLDARNAALKAGKVDAIAGGSTIEGAQKIAEFPSLDLYFMFNKKQAGLKSQIDKAMNILSLENPSYVTDLFAKYFPLSRNSKPSFSKNEKKFISTHSVVKVAVLANDAPFSYKDGDSAMERHGKDSIAVDLDDIYGIAPKGKTRPEFDQIPMWVADMNFRTVPTIQKAIIDRTKHPAFGYFAPRDEYFDEIIKWQRTRNGVAGLDRDDIGYENGVLGGVISTLRVLCQEGDKILIHSPTYIGFTESLSNNGFKIVHSQLQKDNEGIWRMRLSDVWYPFCRLLLVISLKTLDASVLTSGLVTVVCELTVLSILLKSPPDALYSVPRKTAIRQISTSRK